MKKIRTLKDIKNEKLRLRVLQLQQERYLKQSWKEIEAGISPMKFINKQWMSAKEENPDRSMIETVTRVGTEFISRHFGKWAGDTLQQKLNRLTKALRTERN